MALLSDAGEKAAGIVADTVNKALPEVRAALGDAEKQIAATLTDAIQTTAQAIASGVGIVAGSINRLDGLTITVGPIVPEISIRIPEIKVSVELPLRLGDAPQ